MGLNRKYYDDKWNNFIFVTGEIGDWKHAEQLEVEVWDMRKKYDCDHWNGRWGGCVSKWSHRD